MASPTIKSAAAPTKYRIDLEIHVIQSEEEIRKVHEEDTYGLEYIRICERKVQKATANLENKKTTANPQSAKAKHTQAVRELAFAKESRPSLKATHLTKLRNELRDLKFMIMGYDKKNGITTEASFVQGGIRATAEKMLEANQSASNVSQQQDRDRTTPRASKDSALHKKTKQALVAAPRMSDSTKRSPSDRGARLRKAHDEKMAALKARKAHAPELVHSNHQQKNRNPKAEQKSSKASQQANIKGVSADKPSPYTTTPERAGSTSTEHSSSDHNSAQVSDGTKASHGKKRAFTPDTSTDEEEPAIKRSKITSAKAVDNDAEQPAIVTSSQVSSPVATCVGEKVIFCKTGKSWSWSKQELMSDGTVRGVAMSVKAKLVAFAPAPAPVVDVDDQSKVYGLSNHKNGCFFNAALQMLSAGLTLEQILKLRGDKPLSLFITSPASMLSVNSSDGELSSREKTKLQELRRAISISAALSDNSKLDVAPYLGQLLLDLRSGPSKPRTHHVTPSFLQQVIAYGRGVEERKVAGKTIFQGPLQRFDGETQQDVNEFLMVLFDILEEEDTKNAFLSATFSCTEKMATQCKYCAKGSEREDKHTILHLSMAQEASKPDGNLALEDMIKTQSTSANLLQEYACSGCGKQDTTTATSSVASLPDSLLINVARTGPDGSKDKTKLGLVLNDVQFKFDTVPYATKAFIRHSGKDAFIGHYTTFREHGGEWYQIDDSKVSAKDSSDIAEDDGMKYGSGETVMVLLEKMINA